MSDRNYKMMQDVMECLVNMGYSNGDEIPYYDFSECCYSLGLNPKDVDMDYMEDIYDIAIV